MQFGRIVSIATFGLGVLPFAFVAVAQAQSTDEARCRDQIAKNQVKYVSTLIKSTAQCHARRSRGQINLGIDCNDVVAADIKNKVAGGADKFREAIGGDGNRCNNADAVLSVFPSCPAPAEAVDDGGATAGIDDFAEVSECIIALDNLLSPGALKDAFGLPSAVLSVPAEKCQRSIGKAFAKLIKAYGNERRRCQAIIDKQGGGLDYACGNSDPKNKIGRALVKLNDAIVKKCSIDPAEIQSIEACGDDVGELRDCVGDETGVPLGDYLIRIAYVLDGGGVTTTTTTTTTTLGAGCGTTYPSCGGACPPASFCANTGSACECLSATGPCAPAKIIRDFNSKLGTPNTPTGLSTGWTGTAHDVDVPDMSTDTVDVVCDANCENCTVSLDPQKDSGLGNCRCASDVRQPCDVINGPDPDDCTGLDNSCTCFFGAPLAISSGGTPVCIVNQIAEDYAGTMNLRTGEWFDETRLVSLVHLGISTTEPCPTCEGDVTPNDGVRDGTCSGGLGGGACDVNGAHPTFGPTSYDCTPDPLTNISGNGLQLALKFSTGTQTLEYTLPCDPPFGDCPCRVCSGNASLGCNSDAECAAAGAGLCTDGGGAGVQPNECADGICSPQGECEAGPVDTFCDGTTHDDGRGFITCVSDLDCAALGQGRCSISENRRCFPDPIVVSGAPHPTNPLKATHFCIPPTTSAAVNSSAGLPGPGTFVLDFDVDLRCGSDPQISYGLPDGANCTATTTTTTTTLVPPVPCDSAYPVCGLGNDCPAGQGCADTGGACGCVPTTTTTTTTLPSCGSTLFPICGGACPVGQTCGPGLAVCECS